MVNISVYILPIQLPILSLSLSLSLYIYICMNSKYHVNYNLTIHILVIDVINVAQTVISIYEELLIKVVYPHHLSFSFIFLGDFFYKTKK
jgi:hypothetical protein